MHLDVLPHFVDVVGVARREGIDGGAVLGFEDEKAADRRLAVRCHQGSGRHDADPVPARLIEMDTMDAVELRAGRKRVRPVDRMDDEMHGLSS